MLGGCSAGSEATDDLPVTASAATSEDDYVKQVAKELLSSPDPKQHCQLAPRQLHLDARVTKSINWANAFSLLWLGWANLDVKRDDGAGEAEYYKEWGFEVVSTYTDKFLGVIDNKAMGGVKYTLLRKDGVFYLTFRHSNNINDWLADLSINYEAKPMASFALGAKDVHSGFYKYVNTAWNRPDGAGIINALQRLDPEKKTPIIVAGHSLGASLATLAGAGLAVEGYPVRGVYLSGAARVAGPEWASVASQLRIKSPDGQSYSLDDVTFRVANGLDPIARIPTDKEAMPQLQKLGDLLTPQSIKDNPRYFDLASQFAFAVEWLGRHSGSFSTLGAIYEFDQEGQFRTSGFVANKNDAEYWSTLTDYVSKGQTARERTTIAAKTLGYHFVRNDQGYGCVMLRHLMSEHGVPDPSTQNHE
jgi:pimeloyl-ACP methyl ester carboxylesterase